MLSTRSRAAPPGGSVPCTPAVGYAPDPQFCGSFAPWTPNAMCSRKFSLQYSLAYMNHTLQGNRITRRETEQQSEKK